MLFTQEKKLLANKDYVEQEDDTKIDEEDKVDLEQLESVIQSQQSQRRRTILKRKGTIGSSSKGTREDKARTVKEEELEQYIQEKITAETPPKMIYFPTQETMRKLIKKAIQ